MNAKAAITLIVTKMQTAPILLGLIIAPAKTDLLEMDTRAQVKLLQTCRGTMFNFFLVQKTLEVHLSYLQSSE